MVSCTGDGWYPKSLSSIVSIMFKGWVRPWYLHGKCCMWVAVAATTELKITVWISEGAMCYTWLANKSRPLVD